MNVQDAVQLLRDDELVKYNINTFFKVDEVKGVSSGFRYRTEEWLDGNSMRHDHDGEPALRKYVNDLLELEAWYTHGDETKRERYYYVRGNRVDQKTYHDYEDRRGDQIGGLKPWLKAPH